MNKNLLIILLINFVRFFDNFEKKYINLFFLVDFLKKKFFKKYIFNFNFFKKKYLKRKISKCFFFNLRSLNLKIYFLILII